MARRPSSQRSLPMGEDNISRRSSVNTANPNVFSDDYAVDPADSIGAPSPRHSISSLPEELSLDQDHDTQREPREFIPPGLPGTSLTFNESSHLRRPFPAESLGHPRRGLSASSRSIADTRRTLSTSSRFSIPRAQSPYRGPTAPSQPYGMYSQVTRASSIISDATIRPLEMPFIPHGGPEHPYSMYPQNTVPDDDSSEVHVGLTYPRRSQSYQPTSSSSGNEVGDIVGTDGHIEQLPAYSRYADNVIAKGNMADIDPQRSNTTEESATLSNLPIAEASNSDVELRPVGTESNQDEVARKEGLTEKRRRRTLCGLPLWTVLIIGTIVVLAAVTGGVIGGVVGNQHGSEEAQDLAATTTVWLDADPAQTGPATPTCPTGHYQLPFNQTSQIDSCIIDSQYSKAWECLDSARLGINIFDTSGGTPITVVFDDYSVRPQLFRYGPQPPDFNGSSFTLQPYKDKEDDNLGVALFFSVLFDKLIIIPDGKIAPPSSSRMLERSLMAPDLVERGYWDDNDEYLNIGDKPWYCFWNSTISEFWIFLDQNMDDTNQTFASSTITSAPVISTPVVTSSTSMTSGPEYMSDVTSQDPAQGTPFPAQTTSGVYWTGTSPAKRQASVGSPNFPKLAKMVEKRKPDDNVQPYCQQMQVLNNWQIMAIPDVPTICVQESDYSQAAATGGNRKAMHRRSPNAEQQMSSNCICEWFSI